MTSEKRNNQDSLAINLTPYLQKHGRDEYTNDYAAIERDPYCSPLYNVVDATLKGR